MSMRQFGQGGDIGQFRQRIGGRLQEQQPRIGLDRRLPGREVDLRNEIDLDAEALEIALEQADGRTEHATRAHHVIALL